MIAAAVCLFASELMTVFDFTPPGAEPLCAQGGADRHGNALIVLAVFAIGALVIAIFTGSKPAAIAVAACGGVALLIFLIGDLRVANAQGSLNEGCGPLGDSFIDAKAVPQGGFWLEMVGSLALTVTGIALATMTPDQLRALRPPRRDRADRRAGSGRPRRQRPPGRCVARGSGDRREGAAGATRPAATNAPARLGRGDREELPAVVGEGLVGLGHAVDVVLALPGAALLESESRISLASRSAIDFSRRLRAKPTSQRTASVRARRGGTSTGTW